MAGHTTLAPPGCQSRLIRSRLDTHPYGAAGCTAVVVSTRFVIQMVHDFNLGNNPVLGCIVQQGREHTDMSRILVAYFSASGTTASVARQLAKAAGADIYEILPAVPYTTSDLNWMDEQSRSSVEMNDKSSRPALADRDAKIADYDTILLGFPIWWYVAPTIINSFLESYDFSGKKIVLFATSGGSGFGRTAEGLRTSVSTDTTIQEGKVLNGLQSIAGLKAWVQSVI